MNYSHVREANGELGLRVDHDIVIQSGFDLRRIPVGAEVTIAGFTIGAALSNDLIVKAQTRVQVKSDGVTEASVYVQARMETTLNGAFGFVGEAGDAEIGVVGGASVPLVDYIGKMGPAIRDPGTSTSIPIDLPYNPPPPVKFHPPQ